MASKQQTGTGSQKRKLRFQSGDEVISEIERLRSGGYRPTKNWNLSQICQHLTKTMEGEMNGLGFRLPWLLRKTVGASLTWWVLKTQSMPSVPTLPSLQPDGSNEAENPAAIDECIATVRKAEQFSGSLEDYPFVDGLQTSQWRQFMWIHAAHHLGFLIPTSGEANLDSVQTGV